MEVATRSPFRLKSVLRTITFRLTLTVSVAFAASAIALFGLIFWQTNHAETQRLSRVVFEGLHQLCDLPPAAVPSALAAWQPSTTNRLIGATLFAPDGALLGGVLSSLPADLPTDRKVHLIERVDEKGREPVLAAAARLANGDILVVERSLAVFVELRRIVLRALLLGVVPLALLGLAAGALLSLRTVRRLRMMHEAIDCIMRGELSERLPESGGRDDLDRLTRSLNAMLDELGRLIGQIKSVGDNIAHDLRTPLTRIRTRLELGRGTVHTPETAAALIDACMADLDHTLTLVAALLRIAEIEARRRTAGFGPTNLAEIAEEVGDIYAPIAAAQDQTLQVHVQPVPIIQADHDLLVEAIANLVDNAIKFTPDGGDIHIGVEPAPGGALLRVSDTGPGIPSTERDLVLRRFYRGDKSRRIPGHGLGLNLVAAIAKLHNFRFAIEEGPGAVFVLECHDRDDTAPDAHSATILSPKFAAATGAQAVQPRH